MMFPVCRPVAMALMVSAMTVVPACAWAAAVDDDPDEAPALMAMGDFNRDGIPDIAEATVPSGDHAGPRLLTVLLGQKDGSYRQVSATPALGFNPRSIVAGDFNGDGIPDLIVGDGDGSLVELLGDGTGNLVPAGDVARLSSVVSIAVADFNHDGILDIAVSDSQSALVTVLLGSGKGTFRPAWAFQLPRPGVAFRIAAADFNGDGLPDLAVTNADDDTFQVMISNGNGTFTFEPKLSKVRDPNSHCPA